MEPPFPGSARAGAVSAAPEGGDRNLWICGGESEGSAAEADCFRLDSDLAVWTPGRFLHSPRAYAGSAMTRSGLWHVTGGRESVIWAGGLLFTTF